MRERGRAAEHRRGVDDASAAVVAAELNLEAAIASTAPTAISAATRALRVRGGFLYKLGGVSYTIRILMYPACILHVF